MKIKTQFSHYGKLSHSFYEEINMYQIDFHKPLHIHFIGIGGISMSGLAEIPDDEIVLTPALLQK